MAKERHRDDNINHEEPEIHLNGAPSTRHNKPSSKPESDSESQYSDSGSGSDPTRKRPTKKSTRSRSRSRSSRDYHDDEESGSGSDSDSVSGSGSEYSSEEERRRRRKRRREEKDPTRKRPGKKSTRSYDDEESGSGSGSVSGSGSGSEYSSEEERRRRRKRRERRRREEKERERSKRRRKDKEKRKRRREDEKEDKGKKRKHKEKRSKKKKEKEKEKGKTGAVTNLWGKYGTIRETDMWNKRPEFTAWLLEVKKINLESLPNWEEKQMFKEFMEDHNTATFPSKKYYNLDAYYKHKMEKEMKKGLKKAPQTERTVFDDEEQRRLEQLQARERQKEQEVEALKRSMQSGLAQAMKEQAQLREEMAYQYKIGNFEAAAAIQRRLDPDLPM